MTTRRILAIQALLGVGLLSAGLHAQSVGIGTSSPHPSARLHISDNARGLLIPNVALTATNVAAPVTSPATSLLVYNTNTAGTGPTAVTPGFYYWDGSQWVRLADGGAGGGNAWLLTGNANTNPANNFLGTTDAQPLCIRVDNQETFRFNPPGTSAPAWSIQRGGGNPRGLHAVDLQSARSAATQVASGNYSGIGGGQNNTASGIYATVGGGYLNTASGQNATVGGGAANTASDNYATVGGGAANTASGWYAATVGGGFQNTASGYTATVGGGYSNTAGNWYATVGGGYSNTASGLVATVGGGGSNTASGYVATVGGGFQNTASGWSATVAGGHSNTASGDYSAIPGGSYLRVGARSFGFSGQTSTTETDLSANLNIAAFVDVDLWLYSRDFTNASQLRFYEAQAHGSGANYVALRAPTSLSANTTYTLPADLTTTNTVATGILQTDASGNLSWLVPSALGGAAGWALIGNSITSAWNGSSGNFPGTTNAQPLVIATTNTTTPQPIQIWVGNQETFRFNPPGTSAPAWSIQRGGGNQRGLHAVDLQSARSAATQVASGNYSGIGGGQNNTASGIYATVGGGRENTASSDNATVGGGRSNGASGEAATVGGGQSNTASRSFATVGGGQSNTASGWWATVGGGQSNTASDLFATVSGGYQNTVIGAYSVVPGGYSNTANASYNLVFGEDVDPSVTETHRVYFFGPGSNFNPSGFLVINRLDGDHPIHVGTNGTNGNGAHLTAGGTWTNGSSRSFKERFVQYRPAEVLEKILQLPVEGYFYKGTKEYHITPMAEDFYRLFGTGVHEIIETDSTGQLVRRPNPDVDKYLAASDVAGVALLGIQALHEENTQLRKRVSDLETENAQLHQRVSDLETENAQLRQQIADIRTENAALRARLERLETLMQRIASTQTSP